MNETMLLLVYAAIVLLPLLGCAFGIKKIVETQKQICVLTEQLNEAGYIKRPATLAQAKSGLACARVFRMSAILCGIFFVVLEIGTLVLLFADGLMERLWYLLWLPCALLVLAFVFMILYYICMNVLYRVSKEEQEQIIKDYKMSRPTNKEIFVRVAGMVVFLAVVLSATAMLTEMALDASESTCLRCGKSWKSDDDDGNYTSIVNSDMCTDCLRNYLLNG